MFVLWSVAVGSWKVRRLVQAYASEYHASRSALSLALAVDAADGGGMDGDWQRRAARLVRSHVANPRRFDKHSHRSRAIARRLPLDCDVSRVESIRRDAL